MIRVDQIIGGDHPMSNIIFVSPSKGETMSNLSPEITADEVANAIIAVDQLGQ